MNSPCANNKSRFNAAIRFLILGAGCLLVAFKAGAQTPVILSEPQSITVNTGSTADFSVTASNAVSYQWEFQGTNSLSGATNATLSLDDVSAGQQGSYTVVVTSLDNTSVTSAPPAVLTITNGTLIQCSISSYQGGGGSNFLVQLFDHDKPATVQNFIHHIASGAYSNTFFDTDISNVVLAVLLGGDYAARDRTASNLDFGNLSAGTNIFPSQLDSEFNAGPLIPNTFGTLAYQSNGLAGASGFFFNLADNSATLDPTNGGYTVFGRILFGATNSGSNILQYFNTLSAPSNGIYHYSLSLTNLPVNDDSTNAPANTNLFYCDFKFISPTNPPLDTTPPTVSISSPVSGAVFSNASSLTITGTASDNVGLAEVFCVWTANDGQSQTNAATGTTNWSLNLGTIKPGIYQLSAFAQDGAGNLSAPAAVHFTNLALLTLITNVDGQRTTNASQFLAPGQKYTLNAVAPEGERFYSWTSNGVTLLNPALTFTAGGNLTLTVTYLSTHFSPGLAITNPVSGAKALSIQSVLTVSGSFASASVTGITCQFFVNSNSVSAALPANITGTNWSLTVTNLANGSNYTVVALATDAAGNSAFVSANFTLLNVGVLTLKFVGGGNVVSNPGPYLAPGVYTIKATNAPGQVFYSWSDGVTTTLNPSKTFQIVSNLTLTATFIPQDATLKGISFTYPPANAMLTNGTFSVTGNLPASPAVTNMTWQLFLQSNALSAKQSLSISTNAKKWAFPVTNLTPGPYTVLVVGYDNKGDTRLVSENFNLLAQCAVRVLPSNAGKVTSGLNGKYLQVGKTYTISATPNAGQLFAFWTGAVADTNSASTKFVMSTNTVLTACFTNNLFPAVAGTYTGLFLNPSGVSPTNAGFVTITATKTGSFTGSLTFPSRAYPISWAFPYTGYVTLQARGLDSNYLDLVLQLDLTNGTDTITGFVADQPSSGTSFIWFDKH